MEEQQLLAAIEQGFKGARKELREELTNRFTQMQTEFREELTNRFAQMQTELRDEMRTELAKFGKNIHQLGLRFESFSDRLEAVNEHVTVLQHILQNFRKDEFDPLERRVTRVEKRVLRVRHK